MKAIVRLTGLCLVAFAIGTYAADLKTGCCLTLVVLGVGLIVDTVRK
jgi:hypothetical protein